MVDFLNTYFNPMRNHPVYLTTFFLLIVGFAFFYVAITFNPAEVADNMKKYGGFIRVFARDVRPPSTWTTSLPG